MLNFRTELSTSNTSGHYKSPLVIDPGEWIITEAVVKAVSPSGGYYTVPASSSDYINLNMTLEELYNYPGIKGTTGEDGMADFVYFDKPTTFAGVTSTGSQRLYIRIYTCERK